MTFCAIASKAAAGAAGIVAAGLLTATTAFAAAPTFGRFGAMQQFVSASGQEVTDYTVRDLLPSGHNDGVWYSDVTVKAAKGDVTPIVGDFNARAANGATYTSIEGANPYGLTNQSLPHGAQATGRIYFQVNNGMPPDSVVYSPGGAINLLTWQR
jgi:Domain of unknown function (DUF1942)